MGTNATAWKQLHCHGVEWMSLPAQALLGWNRHGHRVGGALIRRFMKRDEPVPGGSSQGTRSKTEVARTED